jgi:hypothetical protein
MCQNFKTGSPPNFHLISGFSRGLTAYQPRTARVRRTPAPKSRHSKAATHQIPATGLARGTVGTLQTSSPSTGGPNPSFGLGSTTWNAVVRVRSPPLGVAKVTTVPLISGHFPCRIAPGKRSSSVDPGLWPPSPRSRQAGGREVGARPARVGHRVTSSDAITGPSGCAGWTRSDAP